jgi:hypothetical protein
MAHPAGMLYEVTTTDAAGITRRLLFRWAPAGWAPWWEDTMVPTVLLDWPTPQAGGRLPAGGHGIRCGDHATPGRMARALADALYLGHTRRVEVADRARHPAPLDTPR